MQETPVWSLVREDRTCRGTTEPVHGNYCALEPMLHNELNPRTATKSNLHSLQLEKATCPNEDPAQPKIK